VNLVHSPQWKSSFTFFAVLFARTSTAIGMQYAGGFVGEKAPVR